MRVSRLSSTEHSVSEISESKHDEIHYFAAETAHSPNNWRRASVLVDTKVLLRTSLPIASTEIERLLFFHKTITKASSE